MTKKTTETTDKTTETTDKTTNGIKDIKALAAQWRATGLAEGRKLGVSEGNKRGLERGLAEGQQKGYQAGHIDGFKEGSGIKLLIEASALESRKIGERDGYARGHKAAISTEGYKASLDTAFAAGYDAKIMADDAKRKVVGQPIVDQIIITRRRRLFFVATAGLISLAGNIWLIWGGM